VHTKVEAKIKIAKIINIIFRFFYKGNCDLWTAETIPRKRRVPRNTFCIPLL